VRQSRNCVTPGAVPRRALGHRPVAALHLHASSLLHAHTSPLLHAGYFLHTNAVVLAMVDVCSLAVVPRTAWPTCAGAKGSGPMLCQRELGELLFQLHAAQLPYESAISRALGEK
jgi:hypothetical protein